MFKRVAFVLVVCSCVGIAFGAAVKIRSFETFDPEPCDADGMTILNYAAGQGKTAGRGLRERPSRRDLVNSVRTSHSPSCSSWAIRFRYSSRRSRSRVPAGR